MMTHFECPMNFKRRNLRNVSNGSRRQTLRNSSVLLQKLSLPKNISDRMEKPKPSSLISSNKVNKIRSSLHFVRNIPYVFDWDFGASAAPTNRFLV